MQDDCELVSLLATPSQGQGTNGVGYKAGKSDTPPPHREWLFLAATRGCGHLACSRAFDVSLAVWASASAMKVTPRYSLVRLPRHRYTSIQ